MEISEIVAQLEARDGHHPREALIEAIARRDEMVPVLLELLESVVEDIEYYADDPDNLALTFALLLLAQWRETRAYPLVVCIFSAPGELPFDLIGESVTENLGQILASVCGGDLDGIKSLIENPNANEYVRSAGTTALMCLVRCGELDRDEAVAYFAGLFGKLERSAIFTWSDIASCCADLCPEETFDQISRAWDEGLIDPSVISWEEIEEARSMGVERCLERLQKYGSGLITDTVGETERWACFEQTGSRPASLPDLPIAAPTETLSRPQPKVGRNDPCPCGSGKKYKKCCGR